MTSASAPRSNVTPLLLSMAAGSSVPEPTFRVSTAPKKAGMVQSFLPAATSAVSAGLITTT